MRFKNPQTPKRPGRHRDRAVRPAPADQAQRRPRAVPGRRIAAGAVGRARSRLHRRLHQRLRAVGASMSPPSTGTSSPTPPGLTREQITEAAQLLRDSDATVFCWAMGLTQHHNAVATIKEVTNLALAQGNIGKPGAGLLPVRGHSNVQGDRTMGIWERPPAHFLDALQREFGFDPPRENGLDTVDSIRALRDGKAHVFIGLGGNFVQAVPDTEVVTDAMRGARLTVHISTKTQPLAPDRRRHRTDPAHQGPHREGHPGQWAAMDLGRGLDLLGALLARSAAAGRAAAEVRGGDHHPDRAGHHRRSVRHRLAGDAGQLLRDPAPHRQGRPGLRELRGQCAPAGRIRSAAPAAGHPHLRNPLEEGRIRGVAHRSAAGAARSPDPADPAQPRPVQHHHLRAERSVPRYRGRPEGDLPASGRHRRPRISPTATSSTSPPGGSTTTDVRRACSFRIVSYDTPRGCAAAYYPETNPLVPLDSTAIASNCPTSKSVIVSLQPAANTALKERQDSHPADGTQDNVGADWSHKTDPEPHHLS